MTNSDNQSTEETKKNREMCRLLNVQLKHFYDYIYVPFHFFRNNDWKISKVLYDNEDILYFNKKYLTDEDKERFYQVFDKLIAMIEEIMNPNNKLSIFLKTWTNMDGPKWKPNGKTSYLKSLMVDKKYEYISPLYIVNVYYQCSKKYKNDTEKIKMEVEKNLDTIVKEARKEIRSFKKTYDEIVCTYVYQSPYDIMEDQAYVLGFVNSIILEILNLAEKLIDLNVYAVHSIVSDIIDYYTPLDAINLHKPSENEGKRIYIV